MSPAPSDYTASLLALLGDSDPYAVQRELVDALRSAMGAISESDLRRPEREGKWSILQVVQHLADNELVYGYRIRMMLTHERPEIQRYDRDAWAARLRYHDAPVDEVLEELGALRRRNLRLLLALTPDELDRVGIHAERGEESVRTFISLVAGHDLLHRRQIERIKRTLGL
jgi:hypothetical protein